MQIKNWTMAFPTSYFTMQNNGIALENPGSALMAEEPDGLMAMIQNHN